MGFFSDILNKAVNDAEKSKNADSGYMPNSIKAKAYEAYQKKSPEEKKAINDKMLFTKFPDD